MFTSTYERMTADELRDSYRRCFSLFEDLYDQTTLHGSSPAVRRQLRHCLRQGRRIERAARRRGIQLLPEGQ
jgi:hypothetical protein